MTRSASRRLYAATLVLALHVASGGAAHAQDPADGRAQRVWALFSDVRTGDHPGLALAVVQNGEMLLTQGHGLANLEHRIPITPATVFDLASLAKQFTGFAIATLVDEGEIRLEDDVREYIPELPDFGPKITIDHLVHHTSGLRDWPGTLAMAGWRYDDVISYDQILRMAYTQEELNFEPGSEYTYSNTGYVLLAEVVARVSGQPFPEWIDERVFRPLGMRSTHAHHDHLAVVPNRAYGYWRSQDGTYRHTPNSLTALGSSSVFSTVDDLARWLINVDRAVVGGGGALALMRTRGVLKDGSTIPYAFGVIHGDYRGLPTIAHSGSWASFRTYLVHFPEQRFGVVVLANGANTNASRAAYDIVDIYLAGELGPADSDARADVTPVVLSPDLLDEYVGLFRLGPGWYVRTRRDGSGLVVRATNEDEVPMTPVSETELWVQAYDAPMVFHRGPDGRVTHLTYRGIEAPRLEDHAPPSLADLEELTGEYISDELQTSYRVELEGDGLVMRHRRHGTFALAHAWRDEFAASGAVMGVVEFQRNETGRVVGLLASAGPRNRSLRFWRAPR